MNCANLHKGGSTMVSTGKAKKPSHRPKLTPPVYRYLRGYAFDPTLSIDLDTAAINELLFPIKWEDLEGPGPIGEYLEVIDIDPASKCMYAPVDLNDPYILAQNGLPPSEGNPQFHQQMVYAVAMLTISNFERALGRKVLWASRFTTRMFEYKNSYVQRLRIYPHALRQANAYYSPVKKALLFGYFPAVPSQRGMHLPGGTVFTCLSHDIIAHETSHALLDGMYRRFVEPSNPDVRAFHEAFADIVALFQRFSFPDVLRHQIALTRGDLAAENLLGQLAQQFGQSTGKYGALRDAIGKADKDTGKWEPLKPDPNALETTLEPHERGAILVAAVFDAFLTIYKSRIADLLRIASNGTGVLPNGALHPDLVNRLADEAAKAARHVLQVSIRALDYLAPVDVTFGEYLRAIITADYDVVPDDDLGYRIAFIEAFRRRGIYPRDVRSLSVDSLRWNEIDEPIGLRMKFERIGTSLLQSFLQASQPTSETEVSWDAKDRQTIFYETKRLRRELNRALRKLFISQRDDDEQLPITGLLLTTNNQVFDKKPWLKALFRRVRRRMYLEKRSHIYCKKRAPGKSYKQEYCLRFEVHTLRLAERVTPDGNLLRQFLIGIVQTRKDGFRGGCTLIIDADTYDLRYAIKKSVWSESRQRREDDYRAYVAGSSNYATFFGESSNEPFALLHSQQEN
jgi:hypothetical protein